jgi:hypothetical protein
MAAAAGGWVLLCASILAIRNTSAVTGYEPDIYTVLPGASLVALIAAVGCFCVAVGADRSTFVGRLAVTSGLTGIVLVAATLFYAPWLRGYQYYGRGDLATHLGVIQTIATSGNVSQQDFYPAARVVGAIIEMATGLGPAATLLIGRIAMTVVFIAGSVSLARIVLGTKRWDVIVATAAAIPIAGSYAPGIVPAEFAAALSPAFVACVVLTARGQAPGLVVVALAICMAISHPLIALVDIFVLTLWVALSAILARSDRASPDQATPRLTSVALVGVVFLAWITPFAVFRNQLLQVRDVVAGEATTSTLARMLDLAARAGFGLIDSARLAVEANIGVLLVLLFAFPAGVAVLLRRRPWPGSRAGVAAIVVLVLTLSGLTLVTAFGLSQLDLFRFVQIAGMVVPVCLGIAAAVFTTGHPRRALAGIVGIFAVSVPFLAASPTLYVPSVHVPPNEVAGILWAAHTSQDGSVPMGYVASAKQVLGYVAPDPIDPLRDPILSAIRIPDHFSAPLKAGASGRLLVPVSDMERYAYGTLWASAGRFTISDFARLDADPTVSKPYAASRIDVYLIGAVP